MMGEGNGCAREALGNVTGDHIPDVSLQDLNARRWRIVLHSGEPTHRKVAVEEGFERRTLGRRVRAGGGANERLRMEGSWELLLVKAEELSKRS